MTYKSFDNNDFLPIKAFACLVGMTVPTLRFYDEKGLFAPAKRGTGTQNKYRLYSPMQITMIKMLRVLTEIGIPLNKIKELGDGRTPAKMIKLLNEYKLKVTEEINFLHDAEQVINTYLNLLYESIRVIETDISILEMPEKKIILGDKNDFTGEEDFYREFIRFCKSAPELKISTSFPIGGYFENMSVFLGEPSRPTRFFSLDPEGNDIKCAGLYLVGYTRGYYGQTNDLPLRMDTFAKNNGLTFNGPVYNIYLADEVSVSDPSQYLLQVSASVDERRRVPRRHPRPRHRVDNL